VKGSRLFTGIILGIVITVVGYLALRSICLFGSARTHLVQVDPSGNIVDPDEVEAYISLSKKNQIRWETTDGSELFIEFEKADLAKYLKNKDPFLRMVDSPDGKSRRPVCSGGACLSIDINPALKDDLNSFTCPRIKYYQVVAGKRVDGWIIVKG
jgi:hypothetical protein